MGTEANQPAGTGTCVYITCPRCSATLKLSGFGLVACPKCSAKLSVAAPTVTVIDEAPTDAAAAQAQPSQSPSPAPEPSPTPADSGFEPDGTIRDRASGIGLFRTRGLSGWSVTGTSLFRGTSGSRPYVGQADLRDQAGGILQLRMGDAGCRQSEGMKAMMRMYGGHLAGIDTTNYADMPDPIIATDVAARNLATALQATDLLFNRQIELPNLASMQQDAYNRFQQAAQASGGAILSDPLAAAVLRTYTFQRDGKPWKMASFTRLEAIKDASGVGDGFAGIAGDIGNAVGDFLNGAGNFLDELFGGKRPPQQAQQWQPQQTQQVQSQQPQGQQPSRAQMQQQLSGGVTWCVPEFTAYDQNGTIFWSITVQATFAAPADDFDAQFGHGVAPLMATFLPHPDIDRISADVARQEAARIQQATQGQLAANQSAFQAQQAAHRQQQAAFDAYNQSISAARDAHHQQFRAATNAQFDTPSSGGAADFSEAIRGVNTYVTSDGREVEVSVGADRAYENQAGDVIGWNSAFDPGTDWTELPKK